MPRQETWGKPTVRWAPLKPMGITVNRELPRTAWLAACAVASTVWPKLALACPACIGTDTRNAMFLRVGSLFVLIPFAVVGLVLYVLRQAPEHPTSPTPRPESR
jgi:hypothetical protein